MLLLYKLGNIRGSSQIEWFGFSKSRFRKENLMLKNPLKLSLLMIGIFVFCVVTYNIFEHGIM